MTPEPHAYRSRLIEKLAESLTGPIPVFTPRRVAGPVTLPGKATAVVGMRRGRQDHVLHQLRRERLIMGGVPRERLVYVNFEDEQIAGITADQLGSFPRSTTGGFRLSAKETVTWCLDGYRPCRGGSASSAACLTCERVEIFLSGSSTALLSREIATAMRGRAWEVLLHPFSFEEVLRHKGQRVPEKAAFLSPAERSGIERAFLDFLAAGGFPEAQGLDSATRRRLLKDYVDVAMLARRHGAARHRKLERPALARAAPAGKRRRAFQRREVLRRSQSRGGCVSPKTPSISSSPHLHDCFLVRIVWMEAGPSGNGWGEPSQGLSGGPRPDPRLRPHWPRELGHALETAVLIELERRRMETTYIKTPSGREVDSSRARSRRSGTHPGLRRSHGIRRRQSGRSRPWRTLERSTPRRRGGFSR